MKLFKNRLEAGQQLAMKMGEYASRPDVLVLALPRGGVPVAYEVARSLKAPLDVFVVRKLGAPGHAELAMGAIATGGVRVFNPQVLSSMNIPEHAIERVTQQEMAELSRRESLYRGERPPPEIAGRTVILIDDGLATGASMRAAVAALRTQQPQEIVVAVPVAAEETCADFRAEVNRIVCAETPQPFYGVGMWYEDFSQTTDHEVRELLTRARQEAGG